MHPSRVQGFNFVSQYSWMICHIRKTKDKPTLTIDLLMCELRRKNIATSINHFSNTLEARHVEQKKHFFTRQNEHRKHNLGNVTEQNYD